MYAAVRNSSNHPQAWDRFRARRDCLFKEHPQSPLDENQRQAFSGLAYYPYDESYRVWAAVSAKAGDETITIDLPEEGAFNLVRIARLTFELQGTELALTAYWVQGYGGGLFLPFRERDQWEDNLWGRSLPLRYDQRRRFGGNRPRGKPGDQPGNAPGFQLCLQPILRL